MRTSKKEKLTQERLKELLDYCPDTGVFTWRKKPSEKSPIRIGSIAGSINQSGYGEMLICGRKGSITKFIWLYMTGKWPTCNICYKNKTPGDNRFKNLYENIKIPKCGITQCLLKSVLDYDGISGVFTWKNSRGNQFSDKGKIAGNIDDHGYIRIELGGTKYRAHRLVFLWVEGVLPSGLLIDHIDRDKKNNRFENLRLVSHQCNIRNSNVSKNNTSGIKGVGIAYGGKWISRIQIDDVPIYLGSFDTKEEAAMARFEAEKKYNFPECEGSSSAFLFLKARGLI